MKRRQFLATSGTLMSAAALLSFTSQTEAHISTQEAKTERRKDDYKAFNQAILQAIAIGLYAPNAHNTQAWKFKIISDTAAFLYIDENNLLPQTDPPARQVHISTGCFLEALAIGCTGIGYSAEITLFPEGNYQQKDIGKKAIASIKLIANEKIPKHPLWEYIFLRRTNRSVYQEEKISPDVFSKISANYKPLNSTLIFVHQAAEMEKYASIFRKAMAIEFHTLATNEETRKNFRFSNVEAAKRRDGLTFDANGITGVAKFFAATFSKNTQESWNSKGIINKGISNFNKGLASAQAFVLWTTYVNNFESQILHGRDFYSFCLALTQNNMYLHPLNQANEEYKEMDELRKQLDDLVGITGNEKIQMIVRIGRAEVPFESYRRHVTDFLIK